MNARIAGVGHYLPGQPITNEELILLRAEANIGQAATNLPAARNDINLIRQSAGLNNHAPFADAASALDELLNQKRYSLLFG